MNTREKLIKFLRDQELSQAQADEIARVPIGRTYSYISGRSQKILRAQSDDSVMSYLSALAAWAGSDVNWFMDGQ